MDIVKMISKIPGREHIKAFKIVHEQFANQKGVILPDHLNYKVIGNYYTLPKVAKMLNLHINETT